MNDFGKLVYDGISKDVRELGKDGHLCSDEKLLSAARLLCGDGVSILVSMYRQNDNSAAELHKWHGSCFQSEFEPVFTMHSGKLWAFECSVTKDLNSRRSLICVSRPQKASLVEVNAEFIKHLEAHSKESHMIAV